MVVAMTDREGVVEWDGVSTWYRVVESGPLGGRGFPS